MRHGTWWSSWNLISSCLYTCLGYSASLMETVRETHFRSYCVCAGISASGLNAMATYTVSESHEQCTEWTCEVPGNSVLRMFGQQKMYWADLQYQTCYIYNYVLVFSVI